MGNAASFNLQLMFYTSLYQEKIFHFMFKIFIWRGISSDIRPEILFNGKSGTELSNVITDRIYDVYLPK